jgi:hypothetical protein
MTPLFERVETSHAAIILEGNPKDLVVVRKIARFPLLQIQKRSKLE